MRFIDHPSQNDNRDYRYDDGMYMRAEFPIIGSWVKEGSRVLDLGCGNGALIKYLLELKSVQAEGVELSRSGVEVAKEKGLMVKLGRIDDLDTYKQYEDKVFDYAICNVTLHMTMYPEVVLREMKRVAKYSIISFPNFAHILQRLDLLFYGRMPKPLLYGYDWYNTGQIHQCSIKDFEMLAKKIGFRIIASDHVGRWGVLARRFCPKLLSKEGIYLLTD